MCASFPKPGWKKWSKPLCGPAAHVGAQALPTHVIGRMHVWFHHEVTPCPDLCELALDRFRQWIVEVLFAPSQ